MLEKEPTSDAIDRKFNYVVQDLMRDAEMYELSDGIEDLAQMMEAYLLEAERHYVARFISAERAGMRLFVEAQFDDDDVNDQSFDDLDEDSELIRDIIVQASVIGITLANEDGEALVTINQVMDTRAEIEGSLDMLQFVPDFKSETPNYHLDEVSSALRGIIAPPMKDTPTPSQDPYEIMRLFDHATQLIASSPHKTLWQIDELEHDVELPSPANMFINVERMLPLAARARGLGDCAVTQMKFLDFNTESGYLVEFVDDALVAVRRGTIQANDFAPVTELYPNEDEADDQPIDEEALFSLMRRLGLHYKTQYSD